MTEQGTPEYANFWRRLLAALIDNLAWLIFYVWLLGDLVALVYDESPEAAGVIVFVFLSLWFNYFAFSEWRWGQTMGKNATGIEVVSADGAKLTYGQASIRNLLRLVDIFVIGWVMVISGSRKQRLGDKAAKTYVVRKPPKALPAPPQQAASQASPYVAGESWQRYSSSGSGPRPQAPLAPIVPRIPNPAGGPPASTAAATSGSPMPGGIGVNEFTWVTWAPIQVLAGIVAAILLAGISGAILVIAIDPGADGDDISTAATLAAQVALWASLVGVALGVATKMRMRGFREAFGRLGFRGLTWSQVGLAALVVLVYLIGAAIVAAILNAAFGFAPEQEELQESLDLDLTPVAVAGIYISACVIAPLTEEAFFRGFVFGGLRPKYGFWIAAAISGLIFGIVHAGTGVSAIPFLAALGVAFAYLYERTGSIWPCVIAHALNNVLAVSFQLWT